MNIYVIGQCVGVFGPDSKIKTIEFQTQGWINGLQINSVSVDFDRELEIKINGDYIFLMNVEKIINGKINGKGLSANIKELEF